MGRKIKIGAFILGVVLSLFSVVALGLWGFTKFSRSGSSSVQVVLPETKGKKATGNIDARNKALEDKIAALAPKGLNVVVDTAANKLYIRQGTEVKREAIVSCGSGNILPNPNGKEWIFDTPRGEYKVERKLTNPMWVKPDWAYVEEGKPIPAKNDPDRYEPGVLGDYALGIGRGYFLHGTIYKRMLGRNVTHGCVRIGDEDLKVLYTLAPQGTKVYIY